MKTKFAVLVLAPTLAAQFAFSGLPVRAAQLPLKVSDTHRYLVDQKGQPFLVVGDTAWSLIVQLEEPDLSRYLSDRKEKGFDSIIVNLLEHKFCTHAPQTHSGLPPFKIPGDFSTPNPAYFTWAHQVIETANEHGIVVWLAPAYLGYGGGDEGFFKEMKAGGKEKLHAYGRFLGERFRDLPNLVWLLGGDYTPQKDDRWTVTELAVAIQERDDIHPLTVHASPENSAATVFGTEKWLTLDTVYSYEPALFGPLLREYSLEPARPFVLIETTYEGEHDSKPQQIRRQAYWAMLAGGCGQFFGNNPIWHFDGPGLFPTKWSWQQALESDGSRDMARLAKLFSDLPWPQIQPEQNHSIVTGGYGQGTNTVLTAWIPGKLSISYLPSSGKEGRELTLDTSPFAGPVSGRWYNPARGEFTALAGSPLPKQSRYTVRSPGENGAHRSDWVLLLDAR